MQVGGDLMASSNNQLNGERSRSGVRLTVLILGIVALGFFASAFLLLAIK